MPKSTAFYQYESFTDNEWNHVKGLWNDVFNYRHELAEAFTADAIAACMTVEKEDFILSNLEDKPVVAATDVIADDFIYLWQCGSTRIAPVYIRKHLVGEWDGDTDPTFKVYKTRYYFYSVVAFTFLLLLNKYYEDKIAPVDTIGEAELGSEELAVIKQFVEQHSGN